MIPEWVRHVQLIVPLLHHVLRHIRSGLDANADGLRGNNYASYSVQRRLRLVLWQADVVAVHEAGEEQEHLHAGQGIAQAPSTTHTERHEEVWSMDVAVWADESFRDELLGPVPQLWTHVDALDERNDLGSCWDGVAVHLNLSARRMKRRRIVG